MYNTLALQRSALGADYVCRTLFQFICNLNAIHQDLPLNLRLLMVTTSHHPRCVWCLITGPPDTKYYAHGRGVARMCDSRYGMPLEPACPAAVRQRRLPIAGSQHCVACLPGRNDAATFWTGFVASCCSEKTSTANSGRASTIVG